jgi:type II secretion system protein J
VRAERGFTVVELVVALVIAAIVATAITTSLSNLGRARETARLHMTASRRATDALELIRRDVQSTVRSDDLFFSRFRLAPETAFSVAGEVDRDQMLLFTQRLRSVRPLLYAGEGQEYETQYRIETDGDGATLWRRRDPVPDRHEDAGGVAEPVGTGVIGMRFEAYDGTEWRQDWDSDVDGLPRAVRATVTACGAPTGPSQLDTPGMVVTLQTEIPIDRVPLPKPDPAEEEAAAAAVEGAAGEPVGEAAAPGGGGMATDAGAGSGAGGSSRGGGKGNGNPFERGGNRGGRGGGPSGGNRGGNVPFIPPPSQNRGGGRGGGGG